MKASAVMREIFFMLFSIRSSFLKPSSVRESQRVKQILIHPFNQ
jgi:hypothetical protein